MNIALLGCGYVADFYLGTLRDHPALRLLGVYDLDHGRRDAFAAHHGARAYSSFEELLADRSLELVLNLTNPRSHFETTRACLLAGKHVYSEKPLAMDSQQAAELARLARDRGLRLSSAPCSLLGETAQTLWKAIRDQRVGPIRLVYANFDSGMIHRLNHERWRSDSQAPWPSRDEFEVGCSYEHAGYLLSWLAAFFGPARRIQAYASVRIPEKGIAVRAMAPDFTVGCVEYEGDIAARITCSIVAPADKSLTIIGERGVLYTRDVRHDAAPVYIRWTPPRRVLAATASRLGQLRVRLEHLLRLPFSISGLRIERKVPYARRPHFRRSAGNKPVDFLRGPSELAAALQEDRPCRLSPELGVHLVELIETLQYPERFANPRVLGTTFDPIEPLSWG